LAALIASLNQTDEKNPANRKMMKLKALIHFRRLLVGRRTPLTFGKRFRISCSPDVSETFIFDGAIEIQGAAH
jgi:hypothetical protein